MQAHAWLTPRLICAAQIKEASEELGYQADETFCLKISQLREIFVVRWSVFLLGPAGCGKTAIWKTLLRAQQIFGEKSSFKPINPKAWPLSLCPCQAAAAQTTAALWHSMLHQAASRCCRLTAAVMECLCRLLPSCRLMLCRCCCRL